MKNLHHSVLVINDTMSIFNIYELSTIEQNRMDKVIFWNTF